MVVKRNIFEVFSVAFVQREDRQCRVAIVHDLENDTGKYSPVYLAWGMSRGGGHTTAPIVSQSSTPNTLSTHTLQYILCPPARSEQAGTQETNWPPE